MCGGGKYHINSGVRRSMNMQEEACRTEIRHLSHSHKSKLAQILSVNENWRKLFGIIPKNLEDIGCENVEFVPKYEVNMARDIEDEAKRQQNPVAMVLFDEWGTSGQNRPTVEHLYKLLNQIPLYRASDYIAENILKIAPPERPPNGPGHRIDISLPEPSYNIDIINRMLDGQPTPGTSAIERSSVPGENQDIPRLNNSFKKINVIPDSPSTKSQSTRMTTVPETDDENNDNEMESGDQSQGNSTSGANGIDLMDLSANTSTERINEPSGFEWSSVNSSDLPRCINGSISLAYDSDSVKSDSDAPGRINDRFANEYSSEIGSADPPKSIMNSYSSRDNWSSTAGENPLCIMDSPTTSYGSDSPGEVGNAMLNLQQSEILRTS